MRPLVFLGPQEKKHEVRRRLIDGLEGNAFLDKRQDQNRLLDFFAQRVRHGERAADARGVDFLALAQQLKRVVRVLKELFLLEELHHFLDGREFLLGLQIHEDVAFGKVFHQAGHGILLLRIGND